MFTVAARKVPARGAVAALKLLHPRWWDLDEALDRLPQRAGLLALRVRVREQVRVQSVQPTAPVIGAGAFAASLGNQAQRLAALRGACRRIW